MISYFIPEEGLFSQLQSLWATSFLSQVFHQSLSYLCSEVSLLRSNSSVSYTYATFSEQAVSASLMGLSQLHLLSNTSELSSEAFHPRFQTIWISKRLKFKTTNILAFFCVFHLQRHLDLKWKTWPAWEFLNQKKTQILPTSAANWLGFCLFCRSLVVVPCICCTKLGHFEWHRTQAATGPFLLPHEGGLTGHRFWHATTLPIDSIDKALLVRTHDHTCII